MSTTVLRDYDHHGVVWAPDPPSGLLFPASGRCHGFVHILRHRTGTASVLHADGTAIWFQYGERRRDTGVAVVRLVRHPCGRLLTVGGPPVPAPWQKRPPQPDTGPFTIAHDGTDTPRTISSSGSRGRCPTRVAGPPRADGTFETRPGPAVRRRRPVHELGGAPCPSG